MTEIVLPIFGFIYNINNQRLKPSKIHNQNGKMRQKVYIHSAFKALPNSAIFPKRTYSNHHSNLTLKKWPNAFSSRTDWTWPKLGHKVIKSEFDIQNKFDSNSVLARNEEDHSVEPMIKHMVQPVFQQDCCYCNQFFNNSTHL